MDINLKDTSDTELAELRQRVEAELARRHVIATTGQSIARLIGEFVDAGGDPAELSIELSGGTPI